MSAASMAVRRFHRPGLIVMACCRTLCQFELLAAGRQDPGHDRRLSDAAVVHRRIAWRAGRRRGDARLLRRGAVFVAMLLWPDVHVTPLHPIAILWFGLLGSVFLALMGILTSIWAEKFDMPRQCRICHRP